MIGTREQSEYNMAVSYLNRLNALFYVADEAALDLNSFTWFHSLIALSRELSTWMKEEELKERDTFIDSINKLMSNENKKNKGITEISPALYNKLDKFEIFIRRILKSSGLQDKMKDDMENLLK